MAWVDIDYARSVVKQMYPGDKWRRRVRGMSDDQVLAIYFKHEEERECKKHAKPVTDICDSSNTAESQFTPDYGEQLSLGGVF